LTLARRLFSDSLVEVGLSFKEMKRRNRAKMQMSTRAPSELACFSNRLIDARRRDGSFGYDREIILNGWRMQATRLRRQACVSLTMFGNSGDANDAVTRSRG
jgi:hypothetical protein